MSDLATQIYDMAKSLESLCHYIDVRSDENGPYIIAFGHQDTHSLQIRKLENQFVLELWHGKNSDEEVLTSEPIYPSAKEALEKAKEWLERDAL